MADTRNGSDRKPDPLAQLQQFLTDWERRVDGLANRVMGTDEFSRSMNGLQNLQLGMQKAFLEAMATHLKNLNMPSRDDVTAIGETLLVMERRMARMEAMLAQVVRTQPSASIGAGGDAPSAAALPAPRTGPPRTRQPPSRRASAAGGTAGSEASGEESRPGSPSDSMLPAQSPSERAQQPSGDSAAQDAPHDAAQHAESPGTRYGGTTA